MKFGTVALPQVLEAKPMRPRIASVVLAAGQSTRMGTNKLLADFHGQPLIAATLSQIAASGVDAIFVITGHQEAEVKAACKGSPITFIHNPRYAKGLSTSVQEGITAAQNFDAAFICLGDMPLIRAEDLARMIEAFSVEDSRTLIVPARGRKLGNPVLWGAEHFPALMALKGDRGARSLLEAKRDMITEIEVAHDGIMRDADTPEALEEMRQTGHRISR